jgi:hypothetical protein
MDGRGHAVPAAAKHCFPRRPPPQPRGEYFSLVSARHATPFRSIHHRTAARRCMPTARQRPTHTHRRQQGSGPHRKTEGKGKKNRGAGERARDGEGSTPKTPTRFCLMCQWQRIIFLTLRATDKRDAVRATTSVEQRGELVFFRATSARAPPFQGSRNASSVCAASGSAASRE